MDVRFSPLLASLCMLHAASALKILGEDTWPAKVFPTLSLGCGRQPRYEDSLIFRTNSKLISYLGRATG